MRVPIKLATVKSRLQTLTSIYAVIEALGFLWEGTVASLTYLAEVLQ